MVQTTDFGNLQDPARRREFDGPGVGGILVEREVRASLVVVREVASQGAAEVSLAEDDNVVQTRRASPAAAARRRNACHGRITNLAGADGSGTTPRLGGTVPSSKRPCCHVRSTRGPVRTGRREVLSIRLDGVPFSSDRRAHRAAAVVPAAHRANASGSVSTEGAVRGAGLGGGISDSCAAATSRIMKQSRPAPVRWRLPESPPTTSSSRHRMDSARSRHSPPRCARRTMASVARTSIRCRT
jgi:hypothetical protein